MPNQKSPRIEELEKELELLNKIKDLYEIIAKLKDQINVPKYVPYPVYPYPNHYPIITYLGGTTDPQYNLS